uniref:C-type lectin domain-containing protein n=1 Tax=Caenorhabditis japonica TaxID=281687 RepID=A0A8R1HQ25_CAEJA
MDDNRQCYASKAWALCKYDPNSAFISPRWSLQTSCPSTPQVKPVTSAPSPPILPAASVCGPKCPSNWIFFGSHCYGKLQGPANYYQFADECERRGGQIADNNFTVLDTFLRVAFEEYNLNHIWIKREARDGMSADELSEGNCVAVALISGPLVRLKLFMRLSVN